MKSIRKLFVSANASIDKLVDSMVDHEAVAESELKSMRFAIAQAVIELNKINRTITETSENQKKLLDDAKKWKMRAKSLRDSDEKRAIECLKKANECQSQADIANEDLIQLKSIYSELFERLSKVRIKLRDSQRRSQSLRIRQYCIDAERVDFKESRISELDRLMDKWEAKVSFSDECLSADQLPECLQDIVDQETEEAIREQLNNL